MISLPSPTDLSIIRDPARRALVARAVALIAEAYRRDVGGVRGDAARALRDGGRSYREVADLLGVSIGAVQRMVRQAGVPGLVDWDHLPDPIMDPGAVIDMLDGLTPTGARHGADPTA